MNYIGSKKSLLDRIMGILDQCGIPRGGKALDVFSGTGIVSRALASRGHIVHSNDMQYYSYVLAVAGLNASPRDDLLEWLNNLQGTVGSFYAEYCEKRFYFSKHNGMKIQAIRDEIETLQLPHTEYCYLIACLIEAADRVANTASVYAAYLKNIKRSAQKELVLAPIPTIGDTKHVCTNVNATAALFDGEYEIAYLDPPYNGRQYDSNYHILETIARWDMGSFIPRGKTGLRPAAPSSFCKKQTALQALQRIIDNNFKSVVMSYSNEGILRLDDIINIFKNKYNVVQRIEIPYKRFMSNSSGSPGNTVEYVIVGQKPL